ncbi:PTS system EIIB component [Streptococcus infantis SK1302]|uniref:PTS system EIIB component n=1 Tax=Streptococcus infantis SK1302 TaxID=871237 RepID=A0ABN0B6V5_9STRE|nr:PTS system EIIB component [Streptococcus infantis SK1302]
MTNTEIAKKVIEALGGRENVNSVAHCATRLRVMVKDEAKINKDAIENLEKVQGAFFNSGQYQIIFGTGTVNKMYDEVVALGLPTTSKDEMKAEAAKQGNWFQRAIRTFGDVFCTNHSSYRSNWSLHGCSWTLKCSWNDTSRRCYNLHSNLD